MRKLLSLMIIALLTSSTMALAPSLFPFGRLELDLGLTGGQHNYSSNTLNDDDSYDSILGQEIGLGYRFNTHPKLSVKFGARLTEIKSDRGLGLVHGGNEQNELHITSVELPISVYFKPDSKPFFVFGGIYYGIPTDVTSVTVSGKRTGNIEDIFENYMGMHIGLRAQFLRVYSELEFRSTFSNILENDNYHITQGSTVLKVGVML